jgi:hypothetical protein
MHFLLMFQEVRPISKPRNQLYLSHEMRHRFSVSHRVHLGGISPTEGVAALEAARRPRHIRVPGYIGGSRARRDILL